MLLRVAISVARVLAVAAGVPGGRFFWATIRSVSPWTTV
jgi:hypothetical protein